jgi:MOSC domain-containing protein YiiM
MKLLAICTGSAERLPGKSYKTGIYKAAVNAAVMVDTLGLVGDAVLNRKHHGGPDQAILLEGSRTLDWWAAELGRDLPFGTFGENLVVDGLDNRDVAVGDRFHIGDVVLEATGARSPCNTLATRMGDPKFVRTFFAAARPGIYCRVIRPGMIAPEDPVGIALHAGDRVPVAALLDAVKRRPTDDQRSRLLAAPLSSRWRAVLEA